jgi:hypothetical protein
MKKIYLAAALLLPLLATEARADGWFFPVHGQAGVNFHWNISCGSCTNGGCQLGPWYHYWPLEAHFVTPAPTGYPYWPQPQALPPANPMLPPPQPKPELKPEPKPGAGPEVKPIGYYYYPYQSSQSNILTGPAPSYWYEGR